MTITADKLAIHGGPKAIAAEVTFQIWPPVDKEDEEMVLASLRQPSHAWGPNCVKLQEEFAAWNGNKFCAATNSGTAALHMGIAACDIGAGDEVLVTTCSWTSSATAILHHNAIPIFVDVDWQSMHMDPAKIEAQINAKTKGIVVVHYWGVACDMDAIMAIARKHKLAVIEDACQAHGALYKGRKVGTFGDVAAFSLNQNKNLCGGEGGFFVTDNEEKYVKGRALMNFGEMRAPESNRDFHSYGMGWMYRTSDLPAAFTRSQLRKLDKHNAWAQENFFRLHNALAGTPHLVRSFTSQDRPSSGYAYILRVEPAYVRSRGYCPRSFSDHVAAALRAEGVPVNPARWMLPAHTVFQARNGYGKGSPWTDSHTRPGITYNLADYPVGQECVDSTLWLSVNSHRPPNGPTQIDALAVAIRKVFSQLEQINV